MIDFGDVPASTVLYIPFASYGKTNGESITLTGLAATDIEAYKAGSTTQRASDNGYTLLDTDGIDFDGITGIHGFSIDLSDNSDSDFWAVGSRYFIVVSTVTVDSSVVSFIAATFRIVAAEAITGKPKVDVDGWLGTACATPTVAGVPEVDLTHVAGSTTDVSTIPASVAAILVDTGTTLQAEIDGVQADTEDIQSRLPAALVSGRMDASVGAMAANVMTAAAAASDLTTEFQSGLATAAALATAQADLDVLTGSDGATLATAQANYAPLKPTVAGRTLDVSAGGEAGVDWANVGSPTTTLNLSATTIKTATDVETDTNELQTDWANGGRLDLILDARASQTSVDDLPTNAELATSQAAADDATIAAIAALNNLSAAQVNAEVDAALADIHLDHLLATDYDPAAKPGTATALLNELVESDTGVSRFTANALEQAPTGGSAPTAGEIADAVWDEAQSGHVGAGTFGEIATEIAAVLVDTAEIGAAGAGLTEAGGTGDHLTALATAAALATVDSEVGTIDGIVDAIVADTQDIQNRLPAALVGGRIDATVDATGLEAGALALINAEVDTALADIHLDHLLATDYDPAAKPGTATALLNELVESDTGVSRFTANALEQAPTGGSAPTAGEIADAVWDEAQADHVAAGSFGIVASEIADILTDTGTTLQGELDGIQADTEDIQSRLPAALTGGRIDASVGAMAANVMTAAAAASDLTTELQSGLATAANLATVAGYLDTEIAAILADTNELQTDWANGGRLDVILDAILADTGTDGVVLSAATANQIADALLDRTAGVETNRTLRQALRLILATAVGKLSGAATDTVTIRDTNDGTNRVVATVDADGNRSAVTLDAG